MESLETVIYFTGQSEFEQAAIWLPSPTNTVRDFSQNAFLPVAQSRVTFLLSTVQVRSVFFSPAMIRQYILPIFHTSHKQPLFASFFIFFYFYDCHLRFLVSLIAHSFAFIFHEAISSSSKAPEHFSAMMIHFPIFI